MRKASLCVILGLVWLLAWSGDALAADKRVSFSAQRRPLSLVIQGLARILDLEVLVDLDSELINIPVSVEFQNASADFAMQAVVNALRRSAPDVRLVQKDGIYHITNKPGALSPKTVKRRNDAPTRKVTLALGNVPLREALAMVHRMPGPVGRAALPPVEVKPGVPDQPVTLAFSHDSEKVLARLVVRQAATAIPAIFAADRDGKIVVSVDPPQVFDTAAQLQQEFALPLADPERRLVLCFREMPIRQVLSMVFEDTLPRFGLVYELEIGETVSDMPVSFAVVTGDARQAMEKLLRELKKQVTGLTIKEVGGKLKFSYKNL